MFVFLLTRREGLDQVGKKSGLWQWCPESFQGLEDLAHLPAEHHLNDGVIRVA